MNTNSCKNQYHNIIKLRNKSLQQTFIIKIKSERKARVIFNFYFHKSIFIFFNNIVSHTFCFGGERGWGVGEMQIIKSGCVL